MQICADEVEKARKRFAGRIHLTPIITCESIDSVAGPWFSIFFFFSTVLKTKVKVAILGKRKRCEK